MWRSEGESAQTRVYVPAGRTCPGISTDWLNVMTVFLFHSSARAPRPSVAPSSVSESTAKIVFTDFISIFLPRFYELICYWRQHSSARRRESLFTCGHFLRLVRISVREAGPRTRRAAVMTRQRKVQPEAIADVQRRTLRSDFWGESSSCVSRDQTAGQRNHFS